MKFRLILLGFLATCFWARAAVASNIIEITWKGNVTGSVNLPANPYYSLFPLSGFIDQTYTASIRITDAYGTFSFGNLNQIPFPSGSVSQNPVLSASFAMDGASNPTPTGGPRDFVQLGAYSGVPVSVNYSRSPFGGSGSVFFTGFETTVSEAFTSTIVAPGLPAISFDVPALQMEFRSRLIRFSDGDSFALTAPVSPIDAGIITGLSGLVEGDLFFTSPGLPGFTGSLQLLPTSLDVRVTSVSAVPEPATWAMMLIGFAGLGVAARRRQRESACT